MVDRESNAIKSDELNNAQIQELRKKVSVIIKSQVLIGDLFEKKKMNSAHDNFISLRFNRLKNVFSKQKLIE